MQEKIHHIVSAPPNFIKFGIRVAVANIIVTLNFKSIGSGFTEF